jgi:hypothetical protein
MATEKAETDRVPITLALSTISYLEKLVRQGTHGREPTGVGARSAPRYREPRSGGKRTGIRARATGLRDNPIDRRVSKG